MLGQRVVLGEDRQVERPAPGPSQERGRHPGHAARHLEAAGRQRVGDLCARADLLPADLGVGVDAVREVEELRAAAVHDLASGRLQLCRHRSSLTLDRVPG